MAGRLVTWLVGAILVLTALAGAAAAVAGLTSLERATASAQAGMLDGATQFQRTLTATVSGLATVDSALQAGREAITTLDATLIATTNTLSDTAPTMNRVGQIIGRDVVQVVATVETSLASTRASAAGVDSVMDALASIPLLNLGSLKPDPPLASSINDVVVALAPLPGELINVQKDLQAAQVNMADVERGLRSMSAAVRRIDGTLVTARGVVRQYAGIVSDAQRQAAGLAESLPAWLNGVKTALTIGLAWFGIAQLGLFTHGLDLMARARRKRANPVASVGEITVEEYG